MKLVLDLTKEGYEQLTSLMNNEKIVELATRNAEAKFNPFVKAAVSDLSQEVQKEAAKIVKDQNLVNKQQINKLAEMIASQNGTISELMRGTSENAAMIKTLSADVTNICKGMKVLNAVSWINLGLNAVNLGVSIWEYKVLGDRINILDKRIQGIEDQLTELENRMKHLEDRMNHLEDRMNHLESGMSNLANQVYMNFIFQGKQLLYDAEGFLEKAEQGQAVWADAKVVVKKFNDYLTAMVNALDGRNNEQYYQFIYQLLPIHAEFLNYCYANFYEKAVNDFPEKEKGWRDVFNLMLSKEYRDKMYDYYFLNQKVHNKDVRDILNANFLLVLQSRSSVEDTIEKMELVNNKEYLELLQTLENQQTVEKAEALMPVLEKEYSEEEALKILQKTLLDDYGIKTSIAA